VPPRRIDFLAWRDASNASARCRGLAYQAPLAALGWQLHFRAPAPAALARRLNPRGGPLRVPAKLLYLLVVAIRRLVQIARARRADAVVVQRELLSLGPPVLERLLARVHPCLIYDVDDALDLTPPHLRPLAGGLRDAGKLQRIAGWSRGVVASTAILAARLGELPVPVRVIPTPVDLERFPAPTPEPGGPLRLGWFGTGGNLHYLAAIAPALCRVQAQTGCELLVVSEWEFASPGLEVLNRPWTLEAEVALLLSCHVGLMPLADNPYTQAKAGYKILQHWAAARPVVASPVGFNALLVSAGENGLLATSEAEWVSALLRLAADAPLRVRLGLAGRAKVEQEFSLAVCARRWAALLDELASGGTRPSRIG
jgi:glycosyltransferase involved in cell wall biosynthesis